MNVTLGILLALHEHKRIEGTDTLAELLGTKQELITPAALSLYRLGLIHMQLGRAGRGNKTVYEDKGVITINKLKRTP